MFGHSWRSTYEEALQSVDSNNVKYWRDDGSAWKFLWNSSTSSYNLASPPDERATLSVTGTQATVTLRDGTKRIFTNSGVLQSLVDRNGNAISLTYDASNRLSQVTDAAGRAITFSYADPVNQRQATSVRDSVGTIATYTYDGGSRLTAVVYADGSSLSFTYDANSFVTLSWTRSLTFSNHTRTILKAAV